jgi:succinyl-diaminopimelate desuccinylase
MVMEIERQLAGTGCELTRIDSMPGRPSLAAVLEGSAGGPRLVLNGHTDTVDVGDRESWSVDPFSGEIRDGAVWGRGSVDMKGGLTAQIACAKVLSRMRDRMHGSLLLHFAAGEERGEPGTLSLLESGFVGDWGITTEPTDLEIATAERGIGWFRIVVRGRSAHAGNRGASANPIPPVESLLAALRRYDDEISSRSHALLGNPLCTVTMLAAGTDHNATADTCELTVDRRLIPGETHEEILQDLHRLVFDAIGAYPAVSAEVAPIHHPFEPARITGTPFGSDVRNLVNDAHMEAITFGPGDISLCHCPDEHQSLEALRQATLILAQVAIELLE